MKFAYYGNYAQYFEVGRVEALRSLGFSYKQLEEDGIQLPVLDLHVYYKKPAYYDDELNITTNIKEMPAARIHFEYEVRNESGDLICTGDTTLVFVDAKTGRPMRAPQDIVAALNAYIN